MRQFDIIVSTRAHVAAAGLGLAAAVALHVHAAQGQNILGPNQNCRLGPRLLLVAGRALQLQLDAGARLVHGRAQQPGRLVAFLDVVADENLRALNAIPAAVDAVGDGYLLRSCV